MGWLGDVTDPPSGNAASAVLASGLAIVALGMLLLLSGWTSAGSRTVAFAIIAAGSAVTVTGAVLIARFVRNH